MGNSRYRRNAGNFLEKEKKKEKKAKNTRNWWQDASNCYYFNDPGNGRGIEIEERAPKIRADVEAVNNCGELYFSLRVVKSSKFLREKVSSEFV